MHRLKRRVGKYDVQTEGLIINNTDFDGSTEGAGVVSIRMIMKEAEAEENIYGEDPAEKPEGDLTRFLNPLFGQQTDQIAFIDDKKAEDDEI